MDMIPLGNLQSIFQFLLIFFMDINIHFNIYILKKYIELNIEYIYNIQDPIHDRTLHFLLIIFVKSLQIILNPMVNSL